MHAEIRRKSEPAHDAIHDLARQTRRPVEEVRTVYEQQLAALEADAKVKTFLPILAKRRAREVLTRS